MKKWISLCVVIVLMTVMLILYVGYTGRREMKRDSGGTVASDAVSAENDADKPFLEEGTDKNQNYEENKGRESIEIVREKLAGKLSTATEYISMNRLDLTTSDFIQWLSEKYGEDILYELEELDNKELETKLYTATGYSIYVLLDEFMGIRDYERREQTDASGINISFVGDICLTEDGFVIDYYDTTAGLTECVSPAIISQANSADIFMVNNEFSISDRGAPLSGKMYTFRAMPFRTEILRELGTDIVSLANNHVYDFGAEAFSDTIRYLDEAGIAHVGGGNNLSEAEETVYFEVNGIKIGFISASSAEKRRFTPQAGEDSSGIFLMYEPQRFLDVAADRAKRCDYLIAYVHWGTEDSRYFEAYQHELAVELINRGTDAIIGAHPHVLQGIEYIDGKPVVYSLGDFWFNGETKYTALININVGINGLNGMTVTPCLQSNYTTTLIENPDEKAAFMEYLRGLSAGVNIDENGVVSP